MGSLNKPNRLMSIDIMKGLGILLVAFYHTLEFTANVGLYTFFYYGFGFLGAVLGVFFFVSGYFYKPGDSYGSNILKRVKNLLIPFIFAICATGIIGFVAEWIINSDASLLEYITNLGKRLIDSSSFLPYGDHGIDGSLANVFFVPSWFIVRLFFCNLLFYGLVDFCLKKIWKLLLVVSSLVLAATLYYYFIPVNFLLQLQVVLPCTAIMLIGAYASKKNLIGNLEKGKKDIKYWIVVIVTFVAYFLTS